MSDSSATVGRFYAERIEDHIYSVYQSALGLKVGSIGDMLQQVRDLKSETNRLHGFLQSLERKARGGDEKNDGVPLPGQEG